MLPGSWLLSARPALVAVLSFAVCAILGAAALVDARERRFPLELGVALGLTCASLSFVVGGLPRLARCLALSLAVCTALTAVEVAWRRIHGGAAGMGMGDIKFLFSLSLWRPLEALAALFGGLACLALAGLVSRRDALPLLPFAVPLYVVLRAAQGLGLIA